MHTASFYGIDYNYFLSLSPAVSEVILKGRVDRMEFERNVMSRVVAQPHVTKKSDWRALDTSVYELLGYSNPQGVQIKEQLEKGDELLKRLGVKSHEELIYKYKGRA